MVPHSGKVQLKYKCNTFSHNFNVVVTFLFDVKLFSDFLHCTCVSTNHRRKLYSKSKSNSFSFENYSQNYLIPYLPTKPNTYGSRTWGGGEERLTY